MPGSRKPFTRRAWESSPLAIEMYKKAVDHGSVEEVARQVLGQLLDLVVVLDSLLSDYLDVIMKKVAALTRQLSKAMETKKRLATRKSGFGMWLFTLALRM